MKSHKDLDVWKKSILLVTRIYKDTRNFPSEEKYGLIQQIRRSAFSIPSNIAEGAARSHKKEFIQFLHIALGSASELETQLIISNNLKFLDTDEYEALIDKLTEIRNMLQGLIRYLKK